MLASYAGCDRTVVIVLFCVGMGLMGTFYPGMKVNALDLAPNYAGTIMAIVNGVGAITGIITPLLVGGITYDVIRLILTSFHYFFTDYYLFLAHDRAMEDSILDSFWCVYGNECNICFVWIG